MNKSSQIGTTALVLFSGGQDSTVCLAWALERFARVETIGFDYSQRHSAELEARHDVRGEIARHFPDWAARLGEDHMLALPTLAQISDTALTRESEIFMTEAGLPSTFVPGRNILFFTYAAALGYRRGIADLVGGMCETDYSGYPDCRNETLQSLARTLSLGMDHDVAILTPLMWIDKAGTWALAHELGGDKLVDLIAEHTHTCYIGDRTQRHDWGYGCGQCPACELRANGWRQWRAGTETAATG
ncbi:7-cyano-7-deazaguanine synthase QueC [Dichotomicrobium thermohalophilum]|uniref:7-cyano-7-deazaguanine synthase n=1 Tax=Dichotomicrobium thermohalophilum TaxID=933063 RepID=A0A397Q4U8_9HYPH|nr:7-cyano-7-deazaguanine synthase QueC [Dichotomicrobium thermohalophilum]RIA56510.1 preQ(0) biosynthesis protein QueC [Dichotomicrobium thermohalophilum]